MKFIYYLRTSAVVIESVGQIHFHKHLISSESDKQIFFIAYQGVVNFQYKINGSDIFVYSSHIRTL